MSAVNALGDILLSIRNGKLSEDELQLVIEAVRVTREICARVCDNNAADFTREGAEVCAAEIRALWN